MIYQKINLQKTSDCSTHIFLHQNMKKIKLCLIINKKHLRFTEEVNQMYLVNLCEVGSLNTRNAF